MITVTTEHEAVAAGGVTSYRPSESIILHTVHVFVAHFMVLYFFDYLCYVFSLLLVI